MSNLGKDPRLFGLRSIRQGATTIAEETEMPQAFIRTSGGWTGGAMARYRKDCLPKNQETFARTLGQTSPSQHKELPTFPETTSVEGPVRTGRVTHRGFHRSTRGSNRAFSLTAEFRLNTEKLVKKQLAKPEQNDIGNNRHSYRSIRKRTQLRECRHGKPSGEWPREVGRRRVEGMKLVAEKNP